MKELTPAQRKALRFVEKRVETEGVPPTYQEIADHLGVTVGTAQTHLEGLRKKGFLSAGPGDGRRGHRRLMPVGCAGGGRRVPILGRVPAGPVSQAFELADEYVTVDPKMLPAGKVFGLEVRGDSMRDAGIIENDIVIVRAQAAADPGDIVVARVGEDVTVKRLVRQGGRWMLKPENSAYQPIAADEAEVVGKVVALMRRV